MQSIVEFSAEFANFDFDNNDNILFLKKIKDYLIEKKIPNGVADEMVSFLDVSVPDNFKNEPEFDIIAQNVATGLSKLYLSCRKLNFGNAFIANYCKRMVIKW